MARYFLEVQYNGSAFHGSQVQGSLPTVQLSINKAVNILTKENIETFGASRTDEGVHAYCNYYHFDTEQELNPQFLYKLNAILPPEIAVKHIYLANNTLNARFDALKRRYRYIIYRHKDPFLLHRACFYPFNIDVNVLHQTAAIIKEYTHFETFSKRNTQAKTFTCTIYKSAWEEKDNSLHYVVQANRFLRGMVRGLVGTQLNAARGAFDSANFRGIIESADCTKADFSVPGHGLYLEEIEYPEGSLTLLPFRR
jgi:tRNA pseudouridine38-40 synthase